MLQYCAISAYSRIAASSFSSYFCEEEQQRFEKKREDSRLSAMMFRLVSAKSSSRLRFRLREVTVLFALAASSPLATSLGVQANNQSRPPLSTFGHKSSVPFVSSLSSKSLATRTAMSSEGTTETNQEKETMVSSSRTAASKLESLRAKMKELSLDCYLVPTDDPHLSGKFGTNGNGLPHTASARIHESIRHY